MTLTTEQERFWDDNGYLAIENVIPRDVIEAEKQRFDWLCEHWDGLEAQRVKPLQEPGLPKDKWGPKTVRGFSDLAENEPVFRRHALNPDLLDIVSDLIGTPFGLYETQALLKPPSVGSPKPPHQDNAYFQVEPADAVITCWCALDDATIENGCMQYIPGSHKLGLVKHTWIKNTTHQVPSNVDNSKAVSVPLKAGGVICHHSLTLHMSGENRSQSWRRPLICHYARSDADFSHAELSPQRMIHCRD